MLASKQWQGERLEGAGQTRRDKHYIGEQLRQLIRNGSGAAPRTFSKGYSVG